MDVSRLRQWLQAAEAREGLSAFGGWKWGAWESITSLRFELIWGTLLGKRAPSLTWVIDLIESYGRNWTRAVFT